MHVIAILKNNSLGSTEEAAEIKRVRQIITRDNRSAIIQFYNKDKKGLDKSTKKYLKKHPRAITKEF